MTSEEAAARYRVYALGFAANAMLPQQKVSIGVKYFQVGLQIYLSGIHTADFGRRHVLGVRVLLRWKVPD